LKIVSLQAQNLDDGWGDLASGDRASELLFSKVLCVGEAGNMSVILVDATVLGNLGSALGVDYALNGSHNNVWHGGVLGWIAKALIDELLAVDNVLDPKVKTLRVKAVHSFVGIGMVIKEKEGNIV
jgi:hypothetical protein